MTVESGYQPGTRAVARARAVASLMLYLVCPPAQPAPDAIRLVPALGAEGDNFGAAVAIHGDTAVLGAPLSDEFGPNAGAVCVFELDADLRTWTQTATVAPDTLPDFAFTGRDVALEGNLLIAGSPESPTIDGWPNDDSSNRPGSNKGAAYVFERAQGTKAAWSNTATLAASDGALGDDFGRALALAGNTVAVAAPGHFTGTLRTGAIYLFKFEAATDTWEEVQILLPPQLVDLALFGTAVDLQPTTLAVGAPGAFFSPDNAGAVHVFEPAAPPFTGWNHTAELIGSGVLPGDRFGEAVAVSDNFIAASSVEEDGTVYVFGRSTDGAAWTQAARLKPDPPAPTAGFGQSLAFDDDQLIVGAPFDGEDGSGAAYIFSRGGADGMTWNQLARITVDSSAGGRLGFDLAAHEGTLLMGAPLANGVSAASGLAFVVDTPADSDGDGEADAADNCILTANGSALPDAGGNSQRDTDADGYGNACDADFNNDCVVDFADLAGLRAMFFSVGDSNEDINGDGTVNFADLGLIKASFLAPPGPSGLTSLCEPATARTASP